MEHEDETRIQGGITNTGGRLAAFGREIGQKMRRKPDETAVLPAPTRPGFDPEPTIVGPLTPSPRSTTPPPTAGSPAQRLPLAALVDSPYQPRKRALTKKDVAE